jgi:hypothetical protein
MNGVGRLFKGQPGFCYFREGVASRMAISGELPCLQILLILEIVMNC